MTTKKRKTRPTKRAATEAQSCLLDALTVQGKTRRRPINDEEAKALIAMLALRTNLDALDLRRLIPKGSILMRMVRLFQRTDISFALPLFQPISIDPSSPTHRAAAGEVPALGRSQPTIRTTGLAGSTNTKT